MVDRGTPKYYCGYTCRHRANYGPILLRAMRDTYFNPISQARKVGILWFKYRQNNGKGYHKEIVLAF